MPHGTPFSTVTNGFFPSDCDYATPDGHFSHCTDIFLSGLPTSPLPDCPQPVLAALHPFGVVAKDFLFASNAGADTGEVLSMVIVRGLMSR